MYANWVQPLILDSRLDAFRYTPRYKDTLERLYSSELQRLPLESIRDPQAPITYGILQPRELLQEGALMTRAVDLANPFVDTDSVVRVPLDVELPYRRSRLYRGDVLVAIAGTLGSIGVWPGHAAISNLNQSVARLRTDDRCDAYFLAAYLMSEVGQLLLERESVGSVQRHINLEDLRTVPMPCPPDTIQRAIGNKVRKAERLRALAKAAYGGINKHLSQFGFSSDGKVRQCNYMAREELSNRLDCLHYRSDLLASYHRVMSLPTALLGDKRHFSGLTDGDHGNPVYGDGPMYVRAAELGENRFISETVPRIAESYARLVSKSCWAYPGDVVFSIVGTLGLCAVIPTGGPAVMSRGIARVRPLQLPAYYVKAYMRTPAFASELLRQSVGSVQRGVALAAIASVPIPILQRDSMEAIADHEQTADEKQEEARRLVEEARIDVEHLISDSLNSERLLSEDTEIERWLAANPCPREGTCA